jgi:hypothetical protein
MKVKTAAPVFVFLTLVNLSTAALAQSGVTDSNQEPPADCDVALVRCQFDNQFCRRTWSSRNGIRWSEHVGGKLRW